MTCLYRGSDDQQATRLSRWFIRWRGAYFVRIGRCCVCALLKTQRTQFSGHHHPEIQVSNRALLGVPVALSRAWDDWLSAPKHTHDAGTTAMKITRRFTEAGKSPYASIPFRQATSEIKNPDGSIVFRCADFAVTLRWVEEKQVRTHVPLENRS